MENFTSDLLALLATVLIVLAVFLLVLGVLGLSIVLPNYRNPHSRKHNDAIKAIHNRGGLENFQKDTTNLFLIGGFLLICGIAMKLTIDQVHLGRYLPGLLTLFGALVSCWSWHTIFVFRHPRHPFYELYVRRLSTQLGGLARVRQSLHWLIWAGAFIVLCGIVMLVGQSKL